MEVVVTTRVIRRAKLQSDCHDQQIDTELFTGQPTVSALKGNVL